MTLKTITASIALLGIAVTAAQAEGAIQSAEPAATATSVSPQSVRVMRDRDTGKLRAPTEEEQAAERAARKASGIAEPSGLRTPLAVRQHANGMRSAVLGPDYLITLRAERGADGKLIVKHSDPALGPSSEPQPQQRATE